ncbi:MAG: branched-chain amino acid ABC transporter permease [Desulfotomaculum sp.]|nr:branched-chain amino acid ABC transporter permease [Desulfotomaculum sp.]
MIDVGQVLVNSLVTSSIYLLAGIGLTLTIALSRFSNFAYAELVTLGAFFGLFFLGHAGGSLILALLLAFVAVGLASVVSYAFVFQPLVERKSTLIHLMVASIALGFIFRYSIGEAWGWSVLSYQTMWTVYSIGTVKISSLWMIMIATAVLVAVFLHFFLTRTKGGKAIRAIACNPDLAAITGINKQKIIYLVWFCGAGLAAVAGVFRAADTRLFPMMGWEIILPIFATVVLGGIGNFYGLIVAALIIGLVENIGVALLLNFGLSTEYRIALVFLILIVVLIVRPKGLAG